MKSRKISELIEALRKKDDSIRLNAALDLAKAGIPDGIPVLVEALGHQNLGVRFRWAAKALEMLGGLAIPALVEAVNHSDLRVRPNAATVLYRIDNDRLDIALQTLSNSLHTDDGQVQFDAARSLTEIGEPAKEIVPILAEKLRDYSWCSGIDYCGWYGRAHSWTASALASMSEPIGPIVSALSHALKCPETTNEWFAWSAAKALRTVGSRAHSAIPTLAEILYDNQNSARLRVQAAYALTSIGKDRESVIQTLIQTIDDEDDWLRTGIVKVLGEFSDSATGPIDGLKRSKIVPMLTQSLTDESHHVRRAAAFSLARFGETAAEAVPALISALRTEDTGAVAAEALAKIGSLSITALTDAIKSSDKATRRYAAYAMGKIGKPEVRKILNEVEGTYQPCPLHSDFYHPAPEPTLDEEKFRAFETLYEATFNQKTGDIVAIDYNLMFPKHEFLTFLAKYKNLIMHGSSRSEIDILKPMRQGLETERETDVSGVYAAPDGILPIYYAICDLKRITGQNNGYFTGKDDTGQETRFYFLSVGIDSLREEPWTTGFVYILPRDTFSGGQGPNWTSRVPVRPLAKLPVSREDIPFKIWGMGWTHTSKIFLNTKDEFPFLDAVDIYPIRPIGFK